MVFPTKSTQEERRVISNAMWPIFTGLEQAQTLLNTCLEDHFESFPQKAITQSEAEWLADMLHIVNTSLEDAIASFKLTVCWQPGVEWLEKNIAEHRTALELKKVDDEITGLRGRLPVKERKFIDDKRAEYRGADDETALTAARALLEEAKAIYLKEADQ